LARVTDDPIQELMRLRADSATNDTFAYRASKFVKRNRVGVVATLLVFFALIAGIVGMTYQARAAQRERAEKRFEQVRKLANLPGATATREMLVKRRARVS